MSFRDELLEALSRLNDEDLDRMKRLVEGLVAETHKHDPEKVVSLKAERAFVMFEAEPRPASAYETRARLDSVLEYLES